MTNDELFDHSSLMQENPEILDEIEQLRGENKALHKCISEQQALIAELVAAMNARSQ